MRRVYYVYILANRSKTLYVGVTNNLARGIQEHREGSGPKFVSKYAIHQLVHVECASRPRDAITREKQLKRWSRMKKIALIEESNPEWDDLAESIGPLPG
jgi:putative endonuclease